jgi:hypothetical protein
MTELEMLKSKRESLVRSLLDGRRGGALSGMITATLSEIDRAISHENAKQEAKHQSIPGNGGDKAS